MSERLKKGVKTALIVNSGSTGYKRVTIKLPEEVCAEAKRLSGGRLSAWVTSLIERVVEEERRKALLHALPESLRSQLLEKAGGSEEEAAKLALRLLNLALEEEEEEEAAQEAIGYANKMEAARERRERRRSLG
jgi:predicted RNA-binding protein YlxR (DUF448 family)